MVPTALLFIHCRHCPELTLPATLPTHSQPHCPEPTLPAPSQTTPAHRDGLQLPVPSQHMWMVGLRE